MKIKAKFIDGAVFGAMFPEPAPAKEKNTHYQFYL